VATLRRKGDLLGEMSVITERPCSATIIAKTPCEMICVNIEEFRKITGDNKDQFEHILYRIYSKILTDKVNITNQRAKTVEGMVDQLQRAKNDLQEINSQMEARVVERTQALQNNLQELLNQHLAHLTGTLKEAQQKLDATAKPIIEKSLGAVDGVVRYLEPLVQRFNLEVSMKSKRVLLAQVERKSQTVAKMALGGTGINIEAAATADQAKDQILTGTYDVILIDGDSLDLVELNAKQPKKAKMLYVATQNIKDNLPKLLSLSVLPNIVFVRDEDRAGSLRTIMTTVTKLCSPSIFGLEKYLNMGVAVRELKVRHSAERIQLNEQMREHFTKLGVRASILDGVSVVLEELLMNAIYDAPTDAAGNPLYNKLPRTTAVELKPNEQGLVRFATDGAFLAVSVEDPFGALTGKIIMNYLDSCYSGREGTMQSGKGGAGRGLHQIVELSQYVVFNVHPRRKTEVIAFFNMVPGQKEVTGPMLHYFVQE
jgi:CRP-like cAMP-binding protein